MIELYAITDHPGPPLPAVAPLHAVAHDGLAVVCGDAPAGTAEPSADLLWHHEEVVEALMEDRDLLPVRYGTLVEDEAAAARVLREREEELAQALDRVRGAVELSVRALGESVEPSERDEAASGTEYLRAQARAAAAQASAVHGVHEPLTRLARASVERPPRTGAELLRAAYLVDRRAVDGFVDRVGRLQETLPGVQLLCTGPWPPYSFTDS